MADSDRNETLASDFHPPTSPSLSPRSASPLAVIQEQPNENAETLIDLIATTSFGTGFTTESFPRFEDDDDVPASIPLPTSENDATPATPPTDAPTSAHLELPAPAHITILESIPSNIARWLPNVAKYAGPPPESGASTPNFPMSPEIEGDNPFNMASSPDFVPLSDPPTRRDSFADSNNSLTQVKSEDDTISCLSGHTGTHFYELDENLKKFVRENESSLNQGSAETISTKPLTSEEHMRLPFSFQCAFGWTGEPHEWENTEKNKDAFLSKLSESKNGCQFVRHTLNEFRAEVNTPKAHKFDSTFIKNQNDAIFSTEQQVDEIDGHLDRVVDEVHAIPDDVTTQVLHERLAGAYEHVYPWVMRTKRIVHDNHVWYKLNYVMGAHAKLAALKKKRQNSKTALRQGLLSNGGQASILTIRNGKPPINGTKTPVAQSKSNGLDRIQEAELEDLEARGDA